MARPEKLLTAREVATIKTPGMHADGGGLYLDIDASGRRRWIFRYRFGDKRRHMGLGPVSQVGLAEARAERDRWRRFLAEGVDPIEARAKAVSEAGVQSVPTFAEAMDAYLKARESTWRNAKHRAQWRSTLDTYAAKLKPKPVDQITSQDVLAVLTPIWQAKPETASRVRGRIEMVIDAARVAWHFDEEKKNPARWRGHIDKVLPKQTLTRGNFAAMPFKDAPSFVANLRQEDSVGARALEFTILTAVRTSEAMLAKPEEFDLAEKVWTIPVERMKAKRIHRVPLSERAVAIVREMRKAFPDAVYVFPGARRSRPLSNMAFLMLLRRRDLKVTAHGFRSTFSDWRGESTSFPKELAEAALAHIIGDATERAYRRGDALMRRRKLMDAWARFLDGAAGANVIPLRVQAAR